MKHIQLVGLLITLIALTGCADKKMGAPSFAHLQPDEGITATHPDKMGEEGDSILTFIGIFPIELATETDETFRAVIPMTAVSLNSDKPLIKGFCYTMPDQAFDRNPWGQIPMRCVIIGNKEQFVQEDRSLAIFNKDGGVYIASPIGPVPSFEHTILDDQTYDYKRFETDLDYQKELMREIGRTVPVIENAWRDRIEIHGYKAKNDLVKEIVIGNNSQWKDFTTKMLTDMGGGLEMANGDKVVSFLSEEEMQLLMAKNPEITGWQKFMAHLRVPIGTPEMIAIGTASSIIDGGIAALFDTAWNNACVARGTCQRRYASKTFARLFNLYLVEHSMRLGGE